MPRAALLALLLLAAPSRGRVGQDPVPAAPADGRYPCELSAEILRAYVVATQEPDLAAAGAALEPLGAEIVYGPMTSEKRPKACFLVLRAPADSAPKELSKALRKLGGTARELACSAFDGHVPADGMNTDFRDDALAFLEDVAWIEPCGAWTQLYTEKRLDDDAAREMAKRYGMMHEQNMQLGIAAVEDFAWTLAAAPDAKTADRVLRSVRKLDGVAAASLEGARLVVQVRLVGLLPCGAGTRANPSPAFASLDARARCAPRAAWDTRALHGLLAAAELVLAPSSGSER